MTNNLALWELDQLLKLEEAGGVLLNGIVPIPVEEFYDISKLKAAFPLVDVSFLEKWRTYAIARHEFEDLLDTLAKKSN